MRNYLNILLLICALSVSSNMLAQQTAEEAMKRDYPQLMQKYGSLLTQQKAHYIFAVDISSSMRQYESVVKSNFLSFVEAIPDGDQVTLIRVADENHTDYVNSMYKCITLNGDVRNALRTDIYSEDFKFLSNGHPHDGSDMYGMTKLIAEAVNTIGSNDLTFVYMFTDFEYWTREFHYNPSKEDWNALEKMMENQKQFAICKYGLELNVNNSNLHQHAIVKPQLDKVFGPVDYQAVSSAAVLSQWFNHTIANVMAVKLNSLVERDWNEFAESVKCEVSATGNSVKVNVDSHPTDLVSGFAISTRHDDASLSTNTLPFVENSKGVCDAVIGEYSVRPESVMPSYKTFGGGPIEVQLGFVSPYQSEIDLLQQICKDNSKCVGGSEHQLDMPTVRVWNSIIPLWVWIVAAVILLTVIVSVLYTIFGIKLNKEWQVTVTRRDSEGNRVKESSAFIVAPAEIKSTKDKRPTNDWVVKFTAKKYNPLNVFRLGKTGYYVTLQSGAFLEVMDPFAPKAVLHTLSPGDEVFVSPHRRTDQIILQIKTSCGQYKIDII